MKTHGYKISDYWVPALLGTLAFFIVVGPRVLDPTNIAWLGAGDPATHYLGWLFFRHADWLFPIGLNPDYGLELSSAIIFSDSNPLLAFLFKPFSPFLPATFQYFGIWLFACFVLQSWFGWLLSGLICENRVQRTFIVGLLVFSPPMLWRLYGHLSLMAHFLILAALYLSFRPEKHGRNWAWGSLLFVTALVHPYLLAMVMAVWIANLLQVIISKSISVRAAGLELVAIMSITAIACWQAGYFSVGSGTSHLGFGIYRMNLLSIVDSGGWSYVLKDLPQGDADAGSNFLGLGLVFLALYGLPAVISGKTGIARPARKFPILLAVLAALTCFALSNKVGFGSSSFEYPLPDSVLKLANVFRASERMFWPVFYTLVVVIVFLVVRGYDRRTATYLLGIALVMQMVDTSAAWKGIRKNMMTRPNAAWPSPLASPFWAEAAMRYKKVRTIPPTNHPPSWMPLAMYAGSNGMATDTVYLARIGSKELETLQRKAIESLKTGKFENDAIYILSDEAFLQASKSVDTNFDMAARIDGLNVIAPGWMKCSSCPSSQEE